jgi:hypothetical protein
MSSSEKFEAWLNNPTTFDGTPIPDRMISSFVCEQVWKLAWQAASRAGQEAMRERAAMTCENHPAEFGFKPRVAEAIRAIAIED